MSKTTKIPSLADAVEPSTFVFEYRDLNIQSYIGKLAPSLGLLLTHQLFRPISAISSEFVEPQFFLGLTDFNSSITEALKIVNTTLQASSGTVTLPLTQEMGFGKTHFETLLFHLYTEVPERWKELMNEIAVSDQTEILTQYVLYKPESAKKVLVLPIDLKSASESMDPYTAIFENCIRIISKYKKEYEQDLIKTLTDIKYFEPKRAATELAKQIRKLGKTVPTLILIDELYASVFETVIGGDSKQINELIGLIIFITSFIDELKDHSPVVLVYASAQQDIDRFDEVVKAKDNLIKQKPEKGTLLAVVDHFQKRTSRVQMKMTQIKSSDVINIVRKRLLKLRAPLNEINEPVSRACLNIANELMSKETSLRYYEALIQTYPFSPSYRILADKLLAPSLVGDLPRTQHLRDLLKVTASIIARIYENQEWQQISLISPAYLTHNDINHLVEERISVEWKQLYESCLKSIDEIVDVPTKIIAKKLLSIVYLKSFTTNVSKLLDMIRPSGVFTKEEILLRGTSSDDLLFSVIGAASMTELEKFHDANETLSKSTPYVMDVEHEGREYLVLSFVFNPMELVQSFKNEEIANFRASDGTVDYQKMVEYLRKELETEYNVTGTFTQVGEQPDKPKLALINYDLFVTRDDRNKPKFLDFLDKDKFTILVTTPWSICLEVIKDRPINDLLKESISILSTFKNDLPYPNMIAILFPDIDRPLLGMLCTRIAEMHAARKVVNFFAVEEPEEIRNKRLELAKRAPTYQTLLGLVKEEKKRFEDIMVEIMESLQKRIEEYAKNYTNTAVQDYVSEFVSAFNRIVYLDTEKDVFKDEIIEVSYGTREEMNKVFAELPLWIITAVIGKCSVDKRDSIISKILRYVVEPRMASYEKSLVEGHKVEIEVTPLVDVAMKGWKQLPIRPISRKVMETAMESVSDNRIIGGVPVKTYPRIEKETIKIIIEPLVPKPIQPVPPTPANIIEIAEPINVMLGLGLLRNEKLGLLIKTFNLSLQKTNGCKIEITNATVEDLKWIIGDASVATLINRLSIEASELSNAKLRIELTSLMDKQKIRDHVLNEGIAESSFSLLVG